MPNFTGVLQSELDWSGGSRTFTCTIQNGQLQTCTRSGKFPPVGSTFTQTCTTYYTTSAPIEGGIAQWQCEVVY
jgi:hypothetical protein